MHVQFDLIELWAYKAIMVSCFENRLTAIEFVQSCLLK